MAQIIVPLAGLDALKQSATAFVFGEGTWTGTLETVEARDLPSTQTGEPFAGYTSTDGKRLGLRLGDNQPQEGQDEAGNRKFFVDLVVQDGDESVETVDTTVRDAANWQLQRSALLTASLASALSAIETDGDNVAVVEGFLEALERGDFNGTQLGYVIAHRKSKGNIYPEIRYFLSV